VGHHHTDFDPQHLYFVTTTVVERRHLLALPFLPRVIVDSLHFMRREQWIKIYAYVIMPNHVHLILNYMESHGPSQVMRDFKKFTSKEIVRELQRRNERELLRQLEAAASSTKKQTYKVWDEGYFDKSIYSEAFLFQKIEYIHNNPLQPHWGLAASAGEYPYSSARNYLLGDDSVLEIDHYVGLLGGGEA